MSGRGGAWKTAVFLVAAAGVLLLPAACSTQRQAGGEVLLLAAASTSDAVTEAAAMFEARTGIKIRITTGGSNALANQITAGVPGDVFLSANVKWAETVARQGLVVESRPLLSNRLVIVVPHGNPAGVASPEDLPGDKVKHVALAGEKVPAGLYAAQALIWAKVYDTLRNKKRLVRGRDVRTTLGYVETGEAEAGVVYATDARVSDKVEEVYTFPSAAHDAIVYPLVLLKSPPDRGAAGRRFFEFLFTPAARAIFEKYGFRAAPTDTGAAQ